MCGITGRLWFDANREPSRDLLVRMTDLVTHRGPDAAGYYFGRGIGLGHRRLSIIDLSTGDQPLGNEDGSVQVIFNGEIYNFAEVRRELEGFGHRFRTHSDTEVIAHGFEQWGADCVTRFRGMFAFAVWDERRRILLLARDRLGVKPLYYAVLPDGLVFGSEIKSLLADPSVPPEWSPEALDAYLALGYVPAPRTIYHSVAKLEPGCTLLVEGNRLRRRQYWDLEFTDELPVSEDEYLERLDALLHESVRLRLISDVPLGAFLSGGIDSSAVVSTMVRTSNAPVLTMSVGFEAERYDEVEHALAVARHLGCVAHTRRVTPHVEELLPRLAWHFDEPFADSSAVPTYYVSAAARECVTVALSGDGGDELWAGYARHRVEMAEATARRWLGPAGSAVAGAVGRLLPMDVKGARSLTHLRVSPAAACAMKHAYDYFGEEQRRDAYAPEFAHTVAGADPFATHRELYDRCPSSDPLARALYVDAKTSMVDDILMKVDRMSMAVSLETREPLLDHKLLEYAASVPSSLKLRGGQSKYLLRRLLERRLPAAILQRPKQGFAAPIGGWLSGPLARLVTETLFDGRLDQRGIFRRPALTRLWDEHRSGRRDHRHRLWSLVMLELWFREFVDGTSRNTKATKDTKNTKESERLSCAS